ncbi:hypothetical protein K431DRAFT_319173 [Polychaeton citri CBS 116435]|uniref:Ribosomal protein L9 domain-containing protein n=1 Tax=Polychaeton citri CBS 116435 TaxID=1314669 RepID=A0A9P4QC76_9PEZI|nr:hypothetical protein K431DRAFT_319173 [Polychaeton citri CBS 116435]
MAAPLRPRLIPQCTSCIRKHAFAGLEEQWLGRTTSSLGQQTRGAKKKASNTTGTLPVKLLKDVPTFGKKGTIVPVSQGQMRNNWFPRRVAAYVTMPELKQLRLTNTAVERDFDFDTDLIENRTSSSVGPYPNSFSELAAGRLREEQGANKVPPARSIELVEIFVPRRVDFYRQPIMEEAKAATLAADDPSRPTQESQDKDSGIGTDPLAEREGAASASESEEKVALSRQPQAIYGSVSTHDILMAIRTALGRNDEARRVVLHEDDITFVDDEEGATTGKVKKLGNFNIEIRVKGAEDAVRRILKVNAQEA